MSFVLGFIVHVGLGFAGLSVRTLIVDEPRTAEDHFHIVEQARWQTRHPDRVEEWIDPEPSLAWLASNSEIEHVDLVLPEVEDRRAASRYWLRWVENQPDVLWMTGNPSYTYYQPKGEQPLHIQIWFRESARPAVQQLIEDLQSLPDDDT